MSSPTLDDYNGLMSPWKPIAQFTVKNAISVHDRVEIAHSTKDQDIAKTDSIGAIIGSDDDGMQRDIAETSDTSETDSIAANTVIGYGAQQKGSEMQDFGIIDLDNTDINASDDDGARVDNTEDTNTDNDDPQHIDTKCVAVPTCVANSSDHRKIVSHIFGRNKACTRDLPNNLWIFWCRKHYQRFKYRGEDIGNWHTTQLRLVREQLQTFEDWGEIRNWTIDLRKAEQDTIAKENKNGVTYTNYLSSCWERFLIPFLGLNKTFAQVRDVLNVIERKFNEEEYRNRDKKLKTFPGIEFLPAIHKAKEVKKRPTKKGGTGYKKITLDQAAFKRKTRANAEFLKDEAAKKREASITPRGSGAAVKKEESPETVNASDASATKKRKTSPTDIATQHSAHQKRKSVENTTVTPDSKALSTKRNSMTPTETLPAFQSDATPTKRRRLTRGYEKHGSEGEDSTFMEKEDEE